MLEKNNKQLFLIFKKIARGITGLCKVLRGWWWYQPYNEWLFHYNTLHFKQSCHTSNPSYLLSLSPDPMQKNLENNEWHSFKRFRLHGYCEKNQCWCVILPNYPILDLKKIKVFLRGPKTQTKKSGLIAIDENMCSNLIIVF